MIFSDNTVTDYFSIMALIDRFALENKADISVNEDKLFLLSKRMEVPCINGAENANVFKKSSTFLCEFIGEQIVESFKCNMSNKLKKIPNNGSAIIGFYIVTTMLCRATVQNGIKTIDNPIELSGHSYNDIIDALSLVTLSGSFKLVTVLLEQLVYKSNPNLQYNIHKV